MKKKYNFYFIISLSLFLLSLTQETFCTSSSCHKSSGGLSVLIMGLIGNIFLMGISSTAIFTWIANPLLFLSWITKKSNMKQSLTFSIFSFIFSFSFLFFDKIMMDESGSLRKIHGYRIGYFLWLLSTFTMMLGNLINYKEREKYFYFIRFLFSKKTLDIN